MKKIINYIRTHKTEIAILGLLSVVGFFELYFFLDDYFLSTNQKSAESFAKFSLPLISIFAIILAWKQLQANHDINRRSLAITELYKYIKDLRDYRMQLDELTTKHKIINLKYFLGTQENAFISFTDRFTFYKKNNNEIQQLTAEEFHQWICQKEDGQQKEKIKYIEDSSGNKICETTQTGEKIVHYVLLIINTYEHIAIAVKHKVFDKPIVIDMLQTAIYTNYKFFEKYIEHRRTHHKQKHFAENFENLAREIEETVKPKINEYERPYTDA